MPDDAPFVQAGLDSLTDGDTLFLRLRRYEELLVAPPIAFVMIGESAPEPGENDRPWIDPSNWFHADTVPLFRLPDSSRAIIQNIRFKNRFRRGIVSTGQLIGLKNCVVDSTEDGFAYERDSAGVTVVLENCEFQDNYDRSIIIHRGNSLFARLCTFSRADTSPRFLVAALSSIIDSCRFQSDHLGPLLGCFVGAHWVTNCTFGPAEAHSFYGTEIVYLGSTDSGGTQRIQFSENEFIDCVFGARALRVQSTNADSIEITSNRFIRCTGPESEFTAQGVIGIMAHTDSATARGANVSSNVFEESHSNSAVNHLSFVPFVPAQVNDNQFMGDTLNGLPSVFAGNPVWQPTPLTLRNNRFEDCGYAVELSWAADARFNWWGDNSGPYEATENPDGLGDTITGGVQFVPWLTDSTEDANERAELATDIELTAFPNPFNAQTQIEFTLPRGTQVKVSVFDLLGREVETLSDEVWGAGTHGITFNGERLASGIYFVRLETPFAAQVKRLMLLK